MSYMSNLSQIRPSYSFMGLSREEQKQDYYVDFNNGPSPMQVLGNEMAFKDKAPEKQIYYESQRQSHINGIEGNLNNLNEAK